MKSAFEHIIGGKCKRVVSAEELPSPRQPHVTIESPTQSASQPLAVETVSSSPIQSASDSQRTPNPTSQASLRERLFPNGDTYGLRVLHEPAEPLVDIIFVHGLTGDSYNTWLDVESGTYWPVHLLSKDVPDARIMAFGYDADVTKFPGPVSQNNLRDHALALLNEVAAVRSGEDSVCTLVRYISIAKQSGKKDRKIVFMVFSLGGLVTKKALCLSERAFYPHLQQIDRCTIAVAFLATPHRGSDHARFATSMANILKAGGMRVNKDILQLLRRDSEVLADVEDSYAVWLRKYDHRFDLACFYEELELPGIGRVGSPFSPVCSSPHWLEHCLSAKGCDGRISENPWIFPVPHPCKSYGA